MLRRSPSLAPDLEGTCRGICAIAAVLVAGVCFTATGAPATAEKIQAVSGISRAQLGSMVILQGTVTGYKPPRSARSPHAFMLKDSTGAVRIVFWQNLWEGITFREKLKEEGQKVTLRAEIAEWQGALEGHLRDSKEIALGTTIPPLNSAIPTASVTPSPGLYLQPPATSTSVSPAVAPNTPAASNTVALPGGVKLPAASTGGGAGTVSIAWKSDIAQAQAEARQEQAKILIFFQVPGEANSEAVLTGPLNDKTIAATISLRFVPLRINPQQHPGFKSAGVPAGSFAIYSADGRPLKNFGPVKTAAELTAALQ